MAGCATCINRPRRNTNLKMLLVGCCYWVCLCHIIVGASTLHDVISAAASVDGTTGGNKDNNNNDTNKKKQLKGDDDMPFQWPPTLLNQQHRSFSSFSGQGVQIHTSKRKPDDPDVGVLVRILRSAPQRPQRKGDSPSLSVASSTNNDNGKTRATLVSSFSTSTGRRNNMKGVLRRRRNIVTGDNNKQRRIEGGDLGKNTLSSGRGRIRLLSRNLRSAASMSKILDKGLLTDKEANGKTTDHQSPIIPLQYIIVVVSVPACIVFLFVTLFSFSFFN